MHIDTLNGKFRAVCSFMENDRIMLIPKRQFKRAFKAWAIDACYDNAVVLLDQFRRDMTEDAIALAQTIISVANPEKVEESFPEEVLEGMRPHQVVAVKKAFYEPHFGILHRPRCGKTMTTIRLSSARYIANQIDCLLVVCPTSIKSVWAGQFAEWCKVDHSVHSFEAGNRKKFDEWMKTAKGMKVLVIGVEGLSQGSTVEVAEEFAEWAKGYGMMALDESTRIKNHKSIRTQKIWELGEKFQYRNILTGSEVTRHPEDIFAQFRFLGVHTLGYDSYYAWKGRYCMMGGFQKKKVIAMKNTEEFLDRMAKYSHLVKTSDVVDMPEKTFTVRHIPPTDEQKKVLRDLQKMMEAQLDENQEITVQTAMEGILRAQQVCGGFFPSKQEDGTTLPVPLKKNPKLEELMEVLSEEPGKVIIWARFVPEILAIMSALEKEYGVGCAVPFYGAVSEDDRTANRIAFQGDPSVKYFVGNPTCGSMGLELSAADLMVYYSMDFTYESRIQSLERATNLSKLRSVGIVDLFLDVKADRMIQNANEQKEDMASYVQDAIHSRTFSLDS